MNESKAGAVKFIDSKTGSEVILQSSEVKEITKDEFTAAVGKKEISLPRQQRPRKLSPEKSMRGKTGYGNPS